MQKVQSLKPKLDFLEFEVGTYDALMIAETDDKIMPSFPCDRRDKIGGDVTIYFRNDIIALPKPVSLEALRIEVKVNRKKNKQTKLLTAVIYLLPDSSYD